MKYGICILSTIPLRKNPEHSSEMVSQLLFGETYTVQEVKSEWLHIECSYDKYRGWISLKQHHELAQEKFHQILKEKTVCVSDPIAHVLDFKEEEIIVLIGSSLPLYTKHSNIQKFLTDYQYQGSVNISTSNKTIDVLIDYAVLFLNSPYLWGGRSIFGVDCSGFVQVIFKLIGVKLPRDAFEQAEIGEIILDIEKSKPGDLAFFVNEHQKITHVGLILDETFIIHASGKVRIDTLDEKGIYNEDIELYTHKLHSIRRVL